MSLDGSGIEVVTSIQSSFPNPYWTQDECEAADRTWNPTGFSRVKTTYSFTSLSNIAQVCGYMNGRWLSEPFKVSGRLLGTITSFDDSGFSYYSDASPQYDRAKRIFCLNILYKAGSTKGYECSVGFSAVS